MRKISRSSKIGIKIDVFEDEKDVNGAIHTFKCIKSQLTTNQDSISQIGNSLKWN